MIELRTAEAGLLRFPRRASLEPGDFWPLLDDTPFPAGETARTLEDFLAEPPDREAEQAWVDQALREGLDAEEVSLDNPWAGVLALEVERRRAVLEQLDAYDDALARGEGPEHGHIAPYALVGGVQQQHLVDLADALIEAHPDHAAAEYGRLYLLRALAKREPGDAWDVGLDILRHTEDPLVLGQAVSVLAAIRRDTPMAQSDLDWLGEVLDESPGLLDPQSVASLGLNHAMMWDDRARSEAWLDRLDDAVEQRCNGEYNGEICGIHGSNRDLAVAYIGQTTPEDAYTWRQAFEIAAYACAREGHDWRTAVPLDGGVRWEEDRWRWDDWSPGRGDYAACFERLATSGPPPEARRVQVDVRLIPG